MLSHIFIRNFAIIREIDIDLNDNLNIISGETGTGKSIVIQAINMALGGRGSASMIAEGSEKALVQLIFTLSEDEKEFILQKISDIPDNQLIVSREFNKNGKNLARINGEIVTLATLREITSHLVDIHGQYDNQRLLNPENHIDVLDSFDGKKVLPLKKKLENAFDQYQKTRHELSSIRNNHAEFLRKQDYMQFELNEINTASLSAGEDDELSEHLLLLQNSEKIYSRLSECYDILFGSSINKCITLMDEISDYKDTYSEISKSLSECIYTINDLCEDIRKERDSVTFSPEEINDTIDRLDLIDKLKRKYGGSIENILEYKNECERQLSECENINEREEELDAKLKTIRKEVLTLSAELSSVRRAAGKRLSEIMTSELSELNFSNAQFDVSITANVNSAGQPVLSAKGTDKVEFMFNANKGGHPKPLSEIASGGEISRITLAFKRITNDYENIHTMVFDEIDTGISGITASIVGRKMHQIAANHQILCITHLPQIAAAGDYQYLISKSDDDERSYTTINMLSDEERVHELARLLGGTNITETTLRSAQELIDSFAKSYCHQ